MKARYGKTELVVFWDRDKKKGSVSESSLLSGGILSCTHGKDDQIRFSVPIRLGRGYGSCFLLRGADSAHPRQLAEGSSSELANFDQLNQALSFQVVPGPQFGPRLRFPAPPPARENRAAQSWGIRA